MTGDPTFGARLARLLEHREVDPLELAGRAGLPEDGVRSMLAGEAPDDELLRQIAPALGLHAVDLFLFAGLAVPDHLAPLDALAERWVPYIVMDAVHLPAAGRRELLQLIRLLPQEERGSAFDPKGLAPLADDPGNRIIRMFRYRNLGWTGLAKTLAVVTPTYLAASTFGAISAGRKELTPRLVTDFAALLGIDARDLAALAGVALPELPRPPAPEAADAGALLWEVRRLSAAQAQHVSETARSLRGDSRNNYIINLPGS